MKFEIQYSCPLLQVFDMGNSLKFYCDVLSFTIQDSAGKKDDLGWVWLKWHNAHVMLNTAYETPGRPAQPEAYRVKAHGDTAIYLGCPNIDDVYYYLRSKGLDINPPMVTTYGMKQLYLHDPDGYTICFQWEIKM